LITKLKTSRVCSVTLFGRRVVDLRSKDVSHLVPKLAGRLSGLLFEDIGEIGVFIVAQFKGYFGNGFFGRDQ
jgi:hypothetical protein